MYPRSSVFTRGEGPIRVDNGADLPYHPIHFVVRRIEVGSDANPGVGPVIHQHLAPRKLAGDFLPVGNVDYYHSAAVARIAAGVDAKTRFLGKLNEALGLTNGLGADGLDTDFIDDFIP